MLENFCNTRRNQKPESTKFASPLRPRLGYAVALCESGYHSDPSKGLVAPYPWVLRTPDGPVYGESRAEAERALHRALKKSKSVDVGLMQINLRWNGHRVKVPAELLDPTTNLRVAAEILNELFARHPHDAVKAIGLYHSSNPKRAAGYGRTVWRIYNSLKAY